MALNPVTVTAVLAAVLAISLSPVAIAQKKPAPGPLINPGAFTDVLGMATGTGRIGVIGSNPGDSAFGFFAGEDLVFSQHTGVYGQSDQQGVMGLSTSATGTGVYGGSTPTGGGGFGVRGETSTGVGVQGRSFGTGLAGRFIGGVAVTGDMSFGAQTRQMVNLFATTYGIGVQNSALYQRTDSEFFWYQGGTHSDAFGDAGGGTQLMRLGNTGDLLITRSIVTPVLQITGGTDIAEPFKMSRENTPMGAVVIIDEENVGRLKLSEVAYDTRVAGIVSGANGINPGISLNQQGVTDGGQNVALSGRVYVLADASSSPIKPGDLLTTSDTPGHAMRVTDHAKAQGAVIGKAMSALAAGEGMVLVLVSLQ